MAFLFVMENKHWTKEQTNILITYYPDNNFSLLEISELIGKPQEIVRNKANNMKIKRRVKYKINSNYFDKIDSWEKSYIIGLLWADGHNDVLKHKITLSLQEQDKHILDSINAQLNHNRPLMFKPGRLAPGYKQKNKNQYVLRICDKNISKTLEGYGMNPDKTKTLEFPTCVPDQFLSAFILGFFDGDGTISIKDKKYNIFSICGTLNMMSHIKSVLITECCVDDVQIRQVKSIYLITWANKLQLQKIREFLYKDATLFLTRKKDKFYSIKDYERKYYKNKHLHDLLQ